MAVRAIRGATQLRADDAAEMDEAVQELLLAMLDRNSIGTDALVSILFTATADLTCQFPAAAARGLDLADVPLICAAELEIAGAMPRVVRVMAHADLDVPRTKVRHVYLRGTETLRTDLPPA